MITTRSALMACTRNPATVSPRRSGRDGRRVARKGHQGGSRSDHRARHDLDPDGEGTMAVRRMEGSAGWWRLVEVGALLLLSPPLAGQDTSGVRAVNESLTVRFVDAD